MESVSAPRLRRKPLWTAALVLCCLGVYLLPLQEALVYDRQAILQGQLWRLLTGHLVHFSPEHLLANLLTVAVAGGLVEHLFHRLLPVLVVTSALLISLTMLSLLPEMATFGGLSGVASAALAVLAVPALGTGGYWRWGGLAIVLLLAVKVALEIASGSSLLLWAGNPPFVPVPLAHGVGILVGLGAGLRVSGRGDVPVRWG